MDGQGVDWKAEDGIARDRKGLVPQVEITSKLEV